MGEDRVARSHLGGKPVAKSLDCDLPRGHHACLANQRQHGPDNSGQQPRSCRVVRAVPEMRFYPDRRDQPAKCEPVPRCRLFTIGGTWMVASELIASSSWDRIRELVSHAAALVAGRESPR
jgi:hypothetical protein